MINDQHSYVFNISHPKHKLECFPVPDAGVYSVYAYETQPGIHTCTELHNITVRKSESENKIYLPITATSRNKSHAVTLNYAYIFTGSTLSHAAVSTVDDISEPRVCASCSFTNDSTARGCSVELQNDEFTFVFNMSCQSREELTLLECFPVPEAGVFSVSVYEVDHDGMVEKIVRKFPDATFGSNADILTQSITNGML